MSTTAQRSVIQHYDAISVPHNCSRLTSTFLTLRRSALLWTYKGTKSAACSLLTLAVLTSRSGTIATSELDCKNHKELSVFKWRRKSSATKCWRLACKHAQHNERTEQGQAKRGLHNLLRSEKTGLICFRHQRMENKCVAARRNDNVTSNNNCRVHTFFEQPCRRNRTVYLRECNCLRWQLTLGIKSARLRTTSPAISARAQRSVETDVEVKT